MARRKSLTTKQVRASHWEAHETVLIRSLNTDDDEFITDGLAGINAAGQPQVFAGRQRRLTLQRAIVSWTLTDEHNRPMKVSEDAIRALAPEDSLFIFQEVQALNKPMTPQESEAFTNAATPGTEAVAA